MIEHPDLHRGDGLPSLLVTRAELRLAQRRPQEALDDAVEAGRIWKSELGPPSPGALPWRGTAAMAHLALGQPDAARELAAEELALAREIGVTRVVIRDLCVLGLAEGGEPGIELLAEAVRIGADHPARLAHISALVALGAALRRANQRAAAREPSETGDQAQPARRRHRAGPRGRDRVGHHRLAAPRRHPVGARRAHAQRTARGRARDRRPDHP